MKDREQKWHLGLLPEVLQPIAPARVQNCRQRFAAAAEYCCSASHTVMSSWRKTASATKTQLLHFIAGNQSNTPQHMQTVIPKLSVVKCAEGIIMGISIYLPIECDVTSFFQFFITQDAHMTTKQAFNNLQNEYNFLICRPMITTFGQVTQSPCHNLEVTY